MNLIYCSSIVESLNRRTRLHFTDVNMLDMAFARFAFINLKLVHAFYEWQHLGKAIVSRVKIGLLF